MNSLHTYSAELKKKHPIKHIPIVENIWGHRFRMDQTPAILFFELLCVIESQFQAKRAGLISSVFSPENHVLYFKHRQVFKLRRLIYQNEVLETVARLSVPDEQKWAQQFAYLQGKEEADLYRFNERDIAHIRSGFESFESFYNAITILRSLTFDPLSKKRWTSKFIFPISLEYVWCDFNNKESTDDRRFFARGGEVIYLMLCRSELETRRQLELHFGLWLEKQNSSFAKIARLLMRDEERIQLEEKDRKDLGFLPYHNLPIFNDLGNDLSRVMSLELERLDKIKVMIDLVGYHMGNYILSIGETYHNCTSPSELKKPHYLVEIVSKVASSIRKTSIQTISAQRNKLKRCLSTRADDIIQLYPTEIESEDENERRKKTEIQLKNAELYFAKSVSGYPNKCFQAIGFVSKKNTRSHRYVLTEDFLHSLVVTILGDEKRMELNHFITQLRLKFSIYVDTSPDAEYELIQEDLNRNAKNLSGLLYEMGMLRHLSDACSYVINPYREDSV